MSETIVVTGVVPEGAIRVSGVAGPQQITAVGQVAQRGPKGDQGDPGPKGDPGSVGNTGPANSLSIGTVTTGTAGASITGSAPSQTLNLTLPTGTDATTGAKGILQLAGDLSGTAASPTVPGLTTKAPLASPALTGTPTAPTAAGGTNTTQLATTAFVEGEITSAATPDATTSVKGKIQLAGDLGGTAGSPTTKDRSVRATVGLTTGDYPVSSYANANTAINAAITAVSTAGGGIVHVLPGTYTIVASINPKNNVILEGEGIGATVFKQANSVNIHVITDINGMANVTLRNFEIDGNKANNLTATGHNVRIGHQSSNIRVENVYSHDSATHGFITAYDSSLQNDFLSFIGCRSDNNGVSANGSGFYFNGNTTVEAVNCTAQGNQLDGMQWKTSNNIEIANVVSQNNGRFGFFGVDGHANMSGITAYNNAQIGVHMQGGGELANTSGSITNAYSWFNGFDGFRIDQASHIALSNSKGYNNGQAGVTAAGLYLVTTISATLTTHNRVSNCEFYDDQTTPTQSFGIWGAGSGTVDLNLISDCQIFGNSSTPFRQDTWGSNNIIENTGGVNPLGVFQIGTLGTGSKQFDRANGNYQTATLGGALSASLATGKQRGDSMTLQFTQDATGGRVITWTGTNISFMQGGFSQSSAPSVIDAYTFAWNGSKWQEIGRSLGSQDKLLIANNLSDVASAATAFSNVKQNATTGATGVVQLAGDLGGVASSATVPILKNVMKVFNILDYGAKGNFKTVSDGAISSSSSSLTSATAGFVSGDVGKQVTVKGAGASGADLITTISAFVSGTNVTLAIAAGTTVSAAVVRWVTDDSTAINAAVTACNSAGGGIVYVPPGNYFVYSKIQLPSNITFCGAGWASILTYGDGRTFDGLITNIDHTNGNIRIIVRDLQINGNAANTTPQGSGQNMVWFFGCADYIWENLYVHDTPHGALIPESNNDTNLTEAPQDCRIINNLIDTTVDIGIYASKTDGAIITGNIIRNTGSYGIRLVYAGGNQHNFVSENRLYNCGAANIVASIIAEQSSSYDQINNNFIYNGGGDGIFLANTTYHQVNNNFVYNCRKHGIHWNGAARGTMVGNVCTSNSQQGTASFSGIVLDSCTEANVVGNRSGDTGTTRQAYGIVEIGTSDNNNIYGNLLKRNNTAGLLVIGASTSYGGNLE